MFQTTMSKSKYSTFTDLRNAMHDELPGGTQLVETPKALEQVCHHLAEADILALDTEFIRERYYYPKLEVIQLSDGEFIAVVDVPAVGDLSPLARLLASPERRIIIHSANEDVAILQRDLGIDLAGVFDTQLAAAMVGLEMRMSLARLIQELLGVSVSKDHQRSDWSLRPLSPEQVAYAAEDVRHLHALHKVLEERLEQMDRLEWFREEQALRIQTILHATPVPDDRCYTLVRNWKTLSSENLAILRELAAWREKTCREKNIPRGHLLSDEALVELTRAKPLTREKLQKVRFVNQGQALRHFDSIRKAIQRGQAIPPNERPVKPRDRRIVLPTGVIELCRAIVQIRAEQMHIAPELLATIADLEVVASQRTNPEGLELPLLRGWRHKVCGRHILDLLLGHLSVRVGPDGDLVVEERLSAQ
jgi:ribonuclease D